MRRYVIIQGNEKGVRELVGGGGRFCKYLSGVIYTVGPNVNGSINAAFQMSREKKIFVNVTCVDVIWHTL